jgi:hypothetical protein
MAFGSTQFTIGLHFETAPKAPWKGNRQPFSAGTGSSDAPATPFLIGGWNII